MKKEKSASKSSDLRRLAEKKLKGKKKKKPELSVEKAEELIHELQVHQIELEMQNEELRTAQEDLEQSRSRYADLYDFAPVGYFTFDKNGLILDVNLTGAGQLGMERGLIIKKPFSRFIKKEDQDLFYFHRQQVFKTKARQSCQVKLVRKDKTEFHARLESMVVQDEKGTFSQFRTVVSDVTERKHAEDIIKLNEARLKASHVLSEMADAPPEEISNFVLEQIISLTQSTMSFLGFMTKDEKTFIIHLWSRNAMDECKMIDRPMHFPVDKAGVWAEAVRKRKPVIINNFEENKEFSKGIPAGHVKLSRLMSVPIFDNDKVVALAAVANKESDYDVGDVDQVTFLLRDMWRHKQRREAEETINKLAKFPSESPYPVMRIAQDGTILYANTPSQALLKAWQTEVGGPLPESYEDIIGDVLKDGTRINMEVKLDPRILSLSFVPISEFGYVNVYGFDTTSRKHAEKALLENQYFIQRIADTAPNILYIFDVENIEFIYANHMLEIQLGYSLEGIRKIRKGMERELVHPDDLPKWAMHLNYISRIDDGDIASVILRVKSAQGEWRWLYNRNIVFKRKKGGTVSQVLGAALDITDRKEIEDELDRYRQTLEKMVASRTANLIETNEELEQEISSRKLMEKSLRESEDEFRKLSQEFHDLLDALPDSIMQLSPDLKVTWANRATGLMLGQEESDIRDLHCFTIWHNKKDPCEECPAVRSFSTGKYETFFVTNQKGQSFDIKAIPIKDDDERVHSVMLVTGDVTERTRLQAEALRAAHLASIGELSAGVAHEINNPINGIINYAQILIDRNRKRTDKDLIEDDLAKQIIHEGNRISNIVSSLLSFARDSKADEKGHVNISDVLSDTLALTAALLRKDGIILNVRVPTDIPQVLGHYQQIEQVFLNIINNARYALNEKYAAIHKNKRLEISGEQSRVNGSPGVRITFADTGIGIPADHLDKVIHPFFTSKPGGKGTGLGLSISHGIVTEHNGRLFFESEAGKYTRVMVDLPASDINHQEEMKSDRIII